MTSEERREVRYRRRVAARGAKKAKYAKADNFEQVFSYQNLYRSYRCCRRGVAWKSSVQRYIANAPLNVLQTYRQLHNGRYRTHGFFEFDLFERGKARHIRSTVIGERVVHRCLCDNALVPLIGRTLIYDNGASMIGKGYSFAIDRITRHLREHYRKYGNNGYILLFDFSKFFDNVSHAVIKSLVRRTFTDQRIVALTEHFISAFGDKGVGLGSQISQVLALASANRLDHYIKEMLRIRGYGRYMDDGYLIHPSKAYLKKCLVEIRAVCKELGIVLNAKKTQIIKLSHGFSWLKVRFFLTETGRVVRKIYKRSVTVMRRKLKRLHAKLLAGKISFDDAYVAWQCWRVGYAKNFDAWHTVWSMSKLFDSLFIANMTEEVNYDLYQTV